MNYIELLKEVKVSNAEKIGKSLNENLSKYGMTNEENILFFLANCLNESIIFTKFKENLYYTTADRLKVVFPSAFVSGGYNPVDYLKNPSKLANLVYDDRLFKKCLGNIFDGDGAKYLGRGAIQITGRNNYKMVSEKSGIDFLNKPELLEDPYYAIIGSMVWWVNSGAVKATTLLASRQIVAGNYSKNPFGLQEVQSWYNKLKQPYLRLKLQE